MDIRRSAYIALTLAFGMLAGATSSANADVLYTGSSGSLAASANFSLSGTTLTVTLTNTSTSDVLVPTDVLTALLFTTPDALTPVSALLASGSTVLFGPSGGGNVGGEWAYVNPGGTSSSGFGIFGQANFNGLNLQNPTAVDGLQYGITSAGDNPLTGNTPVTGTNALIKNSVVFTLTVGPGFSLSDISNVSFQYGTALTDPNLVAHTPLPPALLLFGTALVGMGILGRRRKDARLGLAA